VRGEDALLQPGGFVLAVDDQPENLDLLEEILSTDGYLVARASDGRQALAAVEREPPDCIVLDIMMPQLDGFEVCRRLKASRRTRFIPVVMLTALSDIVDKVRGLDAGADDFLNKPVHQAELLARVRSLVRIKRLHDELDTSENIIFSMVQALENKDPTSAGHSVRVACRAVNLARRLSLSPVDTEVVAKAAVLHDLGKIGVPDSVLLPPGPRTPAEVDFYRRHPEIGEQILAPLLSFAPVREIVRHHHERLNGSGYPDGLAGQELTLAAEIVGLSDYFDEHREAGPEEAARAALLSAADGGEFHRDLVEEFLADVSLPAASPGGGLPPWEDLLPPPDGIRTGTILVADDTPANREMMEEILSAAGHEVRGARSGAETLGAVAGEKPDLVLLDIRMPDLDGFEVCRRLRAREDTEFLPIILVTAHQDTSDRREGALAGADDFLMLPLNRMELVARVRSLLRLRLYFKDLEEHQSVLLSLAGALEAKDPYTRGHSERVGVIASRLARQLGLEDGLCALMNVAGQLHDIGKIGIPERLLNKPAELTEDEFETIMTHPTRGEGICRPLRTVRTALPFIRHHHERFDGQGYPDHLVGENIPLGARILGLADAYDALTSERSYRKTSTPEEALAILDRETREGLWDPKVFAALAVLIRRQSGS
jgi:putative two-component system response regulator